MKKVTLLASSLFAFTGLFAQQAETQIKLETITVYPESVGLSRPLSELAAENPYDDNVANKDRKESPDRKHRKEPTFIYSVEKDGPAYGNDESIIQTKMGTRAAAAPIKDWLGQSGGGYPPDPSGAVGPTHYVQMVNATPVKIWQKTSTGAGTGTSLGNLGSLWSPAVSNLGDPIVLYDETADRWFLAQFGQPAKIYIAVSKTNDPLGQYWTYSYNSSSFPDYLKFSIWHDGYYCTTNEGSDRVYVFERSLMLTGGTARMVSASLSTGVSGQGSSFFVPLSADAEGGMPTSGPCPLVYPVDNAWGASSDGVMVKTLTTSWSGSGSLTISSGSIITTTAHDMSYNSSWNDISQPGTTAKLDGIGGVATYRAQWRKWTSYNSIVLSWNVKIDATKRAIKWAELRQTGGPTAAWTLFQEGVYNPDARSRWVPSIAMDDYGNIGMSYARASGSAGDYASCGYTGRCKNDATGQMTIAESMVPGGAGTHSQTNTNRFGDYGQTCIDPSDGKTFWNTQEYLAGGSPKTRIWSFQLNCPVGIGENNYEDLSVYNVFLSGNIINVEASNLLSDKVMNVDLFDINGREISSKQITPSGNAINTTINASGLSAGTYFVRIGNLDFQKVIKVFVK